MSLHYLVKYECSKNCRVHELSEASCHARLSHPKQLLKKSCAMILALLNPSTKHIYTVAILKIPQYDCTYLLRHRRKHVAAKCLCIRYMWLVSDGICQSATQNWSNQIDVCHH